MRDDRFSRTIGAASLVVLCAFAAMLYASGQYAGYGSPEWIIALLAGLVAALALKAAGRRAPVLAAVLLAAAFVVVGPLAAIAATALFIASCIGAGSLLRAILFGEASDGDPGDALLLGLLAHVAVFSVLVHFPVNSRVVYGAVLAAGALAAIPVLRRAGAALIGAWPGRPGAADTAFAALLIGVLAYAALLSRMPTLSHDDQAYHLLLYFQLRDHGRALFDVESQIWAVAPFAADLVHAIPSLVAGTDSRGAVNFALFVGACAQVFRMSRALRCDVRASALNAALYASTPLALMLLTTMQTETLLAYLACAGARLIVADRPRPLAILAAQTFAVAALMAAIKATGAVLGALFVVAIAWTHRATIAAQAKGLVRRARIGLAIGLAIWIAACAVAALAAYAYSAWRTGNPVFPLFNAVFGSASMPKVNLSNELYSGDASPLSFARMFFETSRYQESRDGVAGFQYLFVLPLLVLAWPRRAPDVALTPLIAVAFAYGAIVWSAQQYARYLVPVMPLVSVAFAAVLAAAARAQPMRAESVPAQRALSQGATRSVRPIRFARAAQASVATLWIAILVANLNLSKGAIWYTDTALLGLLHPGASEAMLDRHVPERRLNERVNLSDGARAKVLYDPGRPYPAGLAGQSLLLGYYNEAFTSIAATARTREDVARIFAETGITHVMLDTKAASRDGDAVARWRSLIAAHLIEAGDPVERVADVVLYAIAPKTRSAVAIVTLADAVSSQRPLEILASTGEGTASAVRIGERSAFEVRREVAGSAIIALRVHASCETSARFAVYVFWTGLPEQTGHFRPVDCGPGESPELVDVARVPAGAQVARIGVEPLSGGGVRMDDFRAEALR